MQVLWLFYTQFQNLWQITHFSISKHGEVTKAQISVPNPCVTAKFSWISRV